MSSLKYAFKAHPANSIVKLLLILTLLATMIHHAYQQGVDHAIQTAEVWSEGSTYLVAIDGQIHEYE